MSKRKDRNLFGPDFLLPDGSINPDYVPQYRDCRLPWVQWDQTKFLRGIRGMTASQVGVYAILINEMYERGEALGQKSSELARICGVGPGPFNTIVDHLLRANRMIRLRAGLWDERVEIVYAARISEAARNSQAGVSSGKKRRKIKDENERPLNASPTPNATQGELLKEEEIREGIESLRSSIPKEEEEGAQARVSLSVFEEVMLAVGVDPAKPPKFWRGAPAKTHVLGWQIVHGLSDDEVIEAARLSRGDNPDPPDGPKALDRYVAGYAKAKASAGAIKPSASASPATISKPLDRAGLVQFWADTINRGGFVSASSFSPSLAREILATGLVTHAQLKEKGIVA